jgi:sugar lactone lactonase YvrE
VRALAVVPVPAYGCEDVVVGTHGPDEGAVFTGTVDGSLWRIGPDGRVRHLGHTGGRPLGIEIEPDGRLLVCDARSGLLRVDPATARVETVTAAVDGMPMMFCNNAAIGADGTVWFSDSSTRFGIDRWKDEMVQNTRTGRLLRLAPDGEVTTAVDGLSFANGVALSRDGSFVAVAETGARTVARHWLAGDRAGTQDHLVTDLPGYPDNIARGSDGLIWVTIASPRDSLVDWLQHAPEWLQRSVTKVPERLQPGMRDTIHVQAYDDTGRLVHDCDLPVPATGPSYSMVTGVREHDGTVWLGSLEQPAIASFRL